MAKQYPQFPEDWDEAENTFYRQFYFRHTYDIECLIRLVKENIPDRGNDGVTRAKLLGILWSYYFRANARFWTRHYNPRTWRIRLAWKYAKEWFHRTFKTKHFKSGVQLSNIARDVVKRMEAKKEQS